MEVMQLLGSRGSWQHQIHGGASSHGRRGCGTIRSFLASGSSPLVRTTPGGGAAAWITGLLAVPDVQGSQQPEAQETGHLETFSSLWQCSEGIPGWAFSGAWHGRCSQTLLAGVLPCCLVQQALTGPFWPGSLLLSTSGTQRTTLYGFSLLISCPVWRVRRQRGYSDGCRPCA